VLSISKEMLASQCWKIALRTLKLNVNGVEIKGNVFGMLVKIMEMADVSRLPV